MRTRSIRTGSGYQSSVSSLAFARSSAGPKSASATHGGREHHDRAPVLRLEVAVLVETRAGRALDHALLVGLDLANAWCEGRRQGLVERLSQLRADVALLEEDGGRGLSVSARGEQDERGVDAVEVVERVQRELERLAPEKL